MTTIRLGSQGKKGALAALAALAGTLAMPAGNVASVAAQQRDMLYDPGSESGDIIIPFFDGWALNPDGTYTLSFGFINPNSAEEVEIPLGENNFIEPREFNGMQPTFFPRVSYGGDTGMRERNVFAITVPAEFRNRDVIWTLRRNGRTASVPGRVTVPGYQLSHGPASEGSLRPRVTFDPGATGGTGPVGVVAEKRLTTRVGQPLTVTVWGEDRGERAPVPLEMVWFRHQGPGAVELRPPQGTMQGAGLASGSTTATFTRPGDYVLRVRVANFSAPDSGLGEMCCWTNGFVPVTVTP